MPDAKMTRQLKLYYYLIHSEYHGPDELMPLFDYPNVRMMQRDLKDLRDSGLIADIRLDRKEKNYIVSDEYGEICTNTGKRRLEHLVRLQRLGIIITEFEPTDEYKLSQYEDDMAGYAFEDCGTEYIHLSTDYGFHVYRLNPEYNDNPEPEGWFYGCQKLKRVSNDPIADVQIFPGMFENCTALTHIDLNCIGINQRAFRGCTALKALTAYTFFIREESFANCTALETIDFSRLGIASNCERAFANCTSLKEIVMTERCSSIRPGMFMGCTGLKRAVLPDTLEEVAEDAFSGCTALEDISYFHVEQTEE